MIKIGITIGSKYLNELWNCGIHINVLNLYFLLSKIDIFNVQLLSVFDLSESDTSNKHEIFNDINVKFLNDYGKDYDIIIFMGGLPTTEVITEFHNMRKIKLIYYKCGNDFINICERILWDEKVSENSDDLFTYFDEVWYVPQQEEQNRAYYEMMFKNSIVLKVPFIWSSTFLDYDIKKLKENDKLKLYNTTKEKKVISVLEPNISTTKNCLVPILITEKTYTKKSCKDFIEELQITNAHKYLTNGHFKTFIKQFDLHKDSKISVEHRYKLSFILNNYADIIVSHQQFNPLNYLYLDCVYLGFPILHNGSLCKDIGYYYEGYDINDASLKLEDILLNHDKRHSEYLESNKKALYKYNYNENDDLVLCYKNLILDIYNYKNVDKKWCQNTNLLN